LPERPKKKNLWDVDPAMFELGRKASFFEMRIIPPLRQVGKFGLFALAFMYPVYLVYVGIAFGGLAFWGFFVASVAVMGIVITRLGYAANFRHWDISLKKVSGLLLAFALALGFVSGLVYLKIWLVPIVLGFLALGLFLMVRRSKS
jgi:hypothetical protein